MDIATVEVAKKMLSYIETLEGRVKYLEQTIGKIKNGASFGISYDSCFSLYSNDAAFGELTRHIFHLTLAVVKDELDATRKRFDELTPLKKTQG
jgi:hypothetical protein